MSNDKSSLRRSYQAVVTTPHPAIAAYKEAHARFNNPHHKSKKAHEAMLDLLNPHVAQLDKDNSLDPLQKLNIYTLYTKILIKLEQYEPAILCNLAALSVAPDHIDTLLRRVSLLKRFEKYEDATSVLQQALRISPYNPRVLRSAADLYLKLSQPDMAAHYLELAHQANPKDKFIQGQLLNLKND